MPDYTFHSTISAHEYLADVRPFLLSNEIPNNTLIRIADRVAAEAEIDPTVLFVWVTDADGRVVLAGQHTPPHHLVLSAAPGGAVDLVARELFAAGRELGGAVGNLDSVEHFKDEWTALTSLRAEVRDRLRLLICEEVQVPSPPPGAARIATDADYELIERWLHEFITELGLIESSNVDLRQHVIDGQFWLWCVDDVPVCMLGDRPTGQILAHVGPVYTPSEHRRKGYAGMLTAVATAHYIAQGRIGSLYTDAANPTSNHVYESVGYHFVAEAIDYNFIE